MSNLTILAARTVYLDRSNQQRAAGRCAAVQHPSMTDDPCRMGDADDAGLVDDAEIAAVEAVGGGAEHEQLSRAQPQTALPVRQRAARAIMLARDRGRQAVDRDGAANAADPVAGDACDTLQHGAIRGEVSSRDGDIIGARRQPDDDEVMSLRRALPRQPEDAARHARGQIDDQAPV